MERTKHFAEIALTLSLSFSPGNVQAENDVFWRDGLFYRVGINLLEIRNNCPDRTTEVNWIRPPAPRGSNASITFHNLNREDVRVVPFTIDNRPDLPSDRTELVRTILPAGLYAIWIGDTMLLAPDICE